VKMSPFAAPERANIVVVQDAHNWKENVVQVRLPMVAKCASLLLMLNVLCPKNAQKSSV